MGFDIVHFNLHKTFTQPHGGGGPGAGPIAVSDRIEPYLMVPRVVRGEDGSFDLAEDGSRSRSGACAASRATTATFVRSYAYIRSLGAEGCEDVARPRCSTPTTCSRGSSSAASPSTCRWPSTELCMHEFVLSGAPTKRELGIKTLDIAKRLLDYGYHPPTVYFPLLVDEALLVEPTETENKETLDGFADAVGEDPPRGRG